MIIDITGYVTELHGEDGFKIKVTSDWALSRSFRDMQVSKEVRIWISADRYPSDDSSEFKKVEDKDQRDRINQFRFLSNALRMGDQVDCVAFIVEQETRNGITSHIINKRSKDIKTYADFDLWLCPYDGCFKRLEADSRESLKFRKQWFYTCLNRGKYEKITGYPFGDYGWINKNPKIVFPIIAWIRIKTYLSNLWNRLTRQENPPKTIAHKLAIIGIVVGIISIVATVVFGIISIALAIWF